MCCGHQRTPYRPIRSSAVLPDPEGKRTAPRRQQSPPSTRFRYTGATALTVHGPVSGRIYRFEGPGAALTVDPGDAPALAGVPGLQAVRGRGPVADPGP